MRTMSAVAVLVAAGLATVAAVQAASGHVHEAPGGPQPRVIQLSYSDVNDGSSPRYRLYAFGRRTDSVRPATRYQGKKATADTRYDRASPIRTSRGQREASVRADPKQGGRKVLMLIRGSLDERGEARVRVRAPHDGRVDAIKLRIVLAKCSLDPPLFPVDCEVERPGKHV